MSVMVAWGVPGICRPEYLPEANDLVLVSCWATGLSGIRSRLYVFWASMLLTSMWVSWSIADVTVWSPRNLYTRIGITVLMSVFSAVLEKQRWLSARKLIETRLLMERQSANNA